MNEAPICSSCGHPHGYYSPCHGWSYKDSHEAMPPNDIRHVVSGPEVTQLVVADLLSAIRAIVREEIERAKASP